MKKTVSVTTQGIGRIRNQQFVAHPDMFPDVLLEPDGELPVSWPAELNLFHRAPGHLWTRHSRVRFLAQPASSRFPHWVKAKRSSRARVVVDVERSTAAFPRHCGLLDPPHCVGCRRAESQPMKP